MSYEYRSQAERTTDLTATSDERTYTVLLHLTIFLWHLLVPVLPALVMWLIKKKDSPFVDDHGRESINFQLSLLIYGVILVILAPITCMISWVGVVGLYVIGIVGGIQAAMSANRGEYYRYPMTLRFLG